MARHDEATIAPGRVTSLPAAPFTPGEVIAGRYRMVALIGRGGMGEVYRADDLTLGTPVALKFLPTELADDGAALARFQSEVRIARQVSHPHVCRVFDIGAVGTRTFLSMEFVDGEDLATLLRRIRHLPTQKALELGRQICAGLAAAHEQGVLHRDLKPANIMVDGYGRARITDFGLAIVGGAQVAEFAGTPAYMSPELFAGRPASTRSDIYALGLVLYEMFTGEMPFAAATLHQWRDVHTNAMPSPPSVHVPEIAPAVERAILACLDKNPENRPRSALALSLSLPGGDPLAAAVAAGETPSPEMVAAAGGESAASPRLARTCLAAVLLGLAGLLAFTRYSTDLGLSPMLRSPDVLRDRAQEIVREFRYTTEPVDEAQWIERDYELLRWFADHLPSVEGRQRLHAIGAPVLFTYRSSDRPLTSAHISGLVTTTAPPIVTDTDDMRVVVDGAARLREFAAAPKSAPQPVTTDADVGVAFRRAGLDRSRFVEAEPSVVPDVAFDQRLEWAGATDDIPGLRVSIAWFNGRVVWVAVRGPWAQGTQGAVGRNSLVSIAFATMLFVMLGSAAVMVFRNVRSGRTDRRGARRLAWLAATLGALIFLSSSHIATGSPFAVPALAGGAAQRAAVGAAYMWVLYLAIEPFARRRVPELLVGWARLLEGRWRDAGVAREVMVGLAAGVGMACAMHAANGLPSFINLRGQTPVSGFVFNVYNAGISRLAPVPALLASIDDCLTTGLAIFLIVVFARTLLPRRMAIIATALLMTLLLSGAENPWVEIPNALLSGALIAWTVNTVGLLSFITLWVVFRVLVFGVSLVIVPTTWLAPYAWFTLILLVTLTWTVYRFSLGPARALHTGKS